MEVTIHPCFRLTKEKETPPPKVTTGRSWHRFWLKYSSGCNGVYQIGKAVVLPMIFVVSVKLTTQNRGTDRLKQEPARQMSMSRLKLNIFFQNTRRQWVGCLFAQNTCSPPTSWGNFSFYGIKLWLNRPFLDLPWVAFCERANMVPEASNWSSISGPSAWVPRIWQNTLGLQLISPVNGFLMVVLMVDIETWNRFCLV